MLDTGVTRLVHTCPVHLAIARTLQGALCLPREFRTSAEDPYLPMTAGLARARLRPAWAPATGGGGWWRSSALCCPRSKWPLSAGPGRSFLSASSSSAVSSRGQPCTSRAALPQRGRLPAPDCSCVHSAPGGGQVGARGVWRAVQALVSPDDTLLRGGNPSRLPARSPGLPRQVPGAQALATRKHAW